MKLMTPVTLLLVTLMLASCGNTSRLTREQKNEIKRNKLASITELVESGSYTFNATAATPIGDKNIQLTPRYYSVEIQEDRINGNLPYYGQSHASSYESEGGIQFDGEPDEYEVEINEKRFNVKVSFVVSEAAERISGRLFISHDGYANLSVESSRRSAISYKGYVSERIEE